MGTEGKNVLLTGAGEVRELDGRTSDGIDVRLFWQPQTHRVSVAVTDRRADSSFEFEVDPADALAAFRHPYAYTNDDHGAHALAA